MTEYKNKYRFLDYELDGLARELRHRGELVSVEPKAFDLLYCLVEHRGRTLGKDEIMERLWPRVIVSETSLTRCVMKARKAVGDSSNEQSIIRTVQRRGYRFVADLEAEPVEDTVHSTSSVEPEKPSIVVLPFAGDGNDEASEALATGLTEDVIVDLSRNGWLFVIGRNSSFSYRGQTPSARQVADELGVRYLVEGTVRRSGDQLRVTAQLVDGLTGTQEWADRFDRPLTDLFFVQEEISQGIVSCLGSELRRAEGRRARRADPEALDAWGLVHRGAAISWSSFNRDSNLEAETLYRRAAAIAPDDPRAHAFLANCLAMKFTNGWCEDFEATHREAWQEVRKALDLAPNDPIVLGQVGHAHTCLYEPDTAVRLLRRSIELDPNGCFSIGVLCYALTATGQAREALDAFAEVMRRSPRDPSVHWYLAMASWAHLQLEEFETGLERCQASIDHYDGWQPPWVTLALLRAITGDRAGADAAMRQGRRLAPTTPRWGFQDFFRYVAKDKAQGDRYAALLEDIWAE